MTRSPRISYTVRDWLLASIFAVTVTAMGRAAWHLANVVKDDPLNDLAFALYGGPALMVLLGLFGNTSTSGHPRHRQQLWASMFLGLSAALALEIQLALPGVWPAVLAVPTAWWFVRFYRVKRHRPGAIAAFETDRTVVAIQNAWESLLDRFYEPGWRDRKDEWFSQQEIKERGGPGPITEALAIKRSKGGPDRRISQEDIDEVYRRELHRRKSEHSAFPPTADQGGGKRHEPS